MDLETGNLKFTKIGGSFEKGKVYHGGNYKVFHELTKCEVVFLLSVRSSPRRVECLVGLILFVCIFVVAGP